MEKHSLFLSQTVLFLSPQILSTAILCSPTELNRAYAYSLHYRDKGLYLLPHEVTHAVPGANDQTCLKHRLYLLLAISESSRLLQLALDPQAQAFYAGLSQKLHLMFKAV